MMAEEGSACEGCGKNQPTTRRRPDKAIAFKEPLMVFICDPCDLLREELAT